MTKTNKDIVIEIETSCGQTFKMTPQEMTDRQLEGLIRQNSDRTDVDPVEIAAMRDELARRKMK